MKIEKKGYIRTCKCKFRLKYMLGKTLKFKIIKRRKFFRQRHTVVGTLKGCNLDFRLLNLISPRKDFNFTNPDISISYGSSTNYLDNTLKLDSFNVKQLSLNGKSISNRLLGSKVSYSWKEPKLNLVKSNARDVTYLHSYIYNGKVIELPFTNMCSVTNKREFIYSNTSYELNRLHNYI